MTERFLHSVGGYKPRDAILYGGTPPSRSSPAAMPPRHPDQVVDWPVSPRAALIYRLSGDLNPLHADPTVARAAGFDRPILHGLASYGIAAYVVGRSAGAPLSEIACRFSGIVYPGDKLTFSIWTQAETLLFEAHVDDRRVLDQGRATMAATVDRRAAL